MQTYVAFISGLPFGQKAVQPDALRAAVTRLGFLNVEVFSTSGNVAFDSAPVGLVSPLEAQISRHLRKTFREDDIWTFIRTREQLQEMVRELPFDEADLAEKGNSIYVVLLSAEPDAVTARRLRIKRNDVDELRLARREIYWLRRHSDTDVPPPALSEILEAPATVRSLATIRTIVDRLNKSHAATRGATPRDSTPSERSRQ